MKLRKRVVKLLILVLCVNIFGSIAVMGSDYSSEEKAIKYAQSWAKVNYSDEVTVGDAYPMIDGNDSVNGYCVSFKSLDGRPKGYVVLSTNDNLDCPVVEFSLEGDDIYETLYKNANNKAPYKTNKKGNKKIYNPSPYSYAIEIENDNQTTIFDTNNNHIDYVEYKKHAKTITKKYKDSRSAPKSNKGTSGGFYNSKDISSYTTVEKHNLPYTGTGISDQFIPCTMDYYRKDPANTGNCGPTALANILYYYGQKRGKYTLLIDGNNKRETYNRLIEIAKVEQAMPTSKYSPTLKTYATERGYTCTYNNYLFDSWSDFTRDLKADWPVLTWVDSFEADGKKTGHAIMVIGYTIKKINNKNVKYLRMCDGWYASCDRYMLFDGYYESVNGACVKIYDK